MRTIKIWNNSIGKMETIQSNATTWKQLKEEIPSYQSGMTGIDRNTKNTFEHDDAVLPSGDFTMFLVATKVKSGNA